MRSKTVRGIELEKLKALHEAGLSRVHIGLESGYDRLLAFMKKGVTAREHIEAGKKVKASGLELSEYVILGLGGKGDVEIPRHRDRQGPEPDRPSFHSCQNPKGSERYAVVPKGGGE